LLPLRAFDQRYGLTRDLAKLMSDPREDERVRHSVLSLCRQRVYQIIAGYEDANDANRLRHDPAFQILADQPLGQALGSQPTLSRWENAPSAREIFLLQEALLDWFVRVCGPQVRRRGEILLDVDSTDDPTHGHQQLSFFNGAYNQHMYHPLLVFERHTGCLLAARLRRGTATSCAPMLALPCLSSMNSASSSASSTRSAFLPTRSSNVDPLVSSADSLVAMAAPDSRSVLFPAFRTGLGVGFISAAFAIKPNTPKPVRTCDSW
jgi:hypothetical protein